MQTETTQAADVARAEARLPRWMMAWALMGSGAALLAGEIRVAVGFALGAVLAILNYLWLHQAIESLFAAGHARPTRTVLARFVVRYPLAFASVYLFYRTGWLPFAAVLAGLFVPVGGVLIEALVQLRKLATDS
jgi:hypothetical protein